MVVSGNYSHVQLNYQPFWEKPPFFIWLQAASMNVFGVNEFAARFPNAVCSIVSFISLFLIGKKFHSVKFGLLWCLIYGALILPHLYFKSGIIDPWFNLFIFLSVYNIIIFTNNSSGKREIFNALLAGLFLGLAVLTKGPAAILIVGLMISIVIIWTKNWKLIISKTFILFVISSLLVALSWFIFEYLRGNKQIIEEFIDYQIRLFQTGDSGHDGPFVYHFIVLLLGCFPASFIFIASYKFHQDLTPFQKLFRKFIIVLFWVVLILFSIVKTKIVHYSSLCYYPLTFITTLGIIQYYHKINFNLVLKILFWVISILITIAFVVIGFIEKFKHVLINGNYIDDRFALENLKANVHWNGFEFLIGFIFLIANVLVFIAINKKKVKYIYYGFAGNLLFIYLAIMVIIPKIELYTQHAAVVFYKECAKKYCYVETHRFKSYAYLFYSNRLPNDYINENQKIVIEEFLDESVKKGHNRHSTYANANCYWMKRGVIDRPAYFISKVSEEYDMFDIKDSKKMYEQNGFAFFVRMPLTENIKTAK